MSTFTKADDETVKLLDYVMVTHHKRLIDVDLRVSVIAAIAKVDEETGEPIGPALKHHGYACLAKVRIVKHSDRVQGMADAEIAIDGDRWPFLSRDERVALLDHELTHIEPVLDEGGDSKVDDGGRPKLKSRLHDYEFGWFVEVAQRHADASQEVQQAKAMIDGHGQVLFPFLGGVGGDEGIAEAPKRTKKTSKVVAEATIGRFHDSLADVAKRHGGTITVSASVGGERVEIATVGTPK